MDEAYGLPRKLGGMSAEQLISFARGAPSLDIIDVAGLKAAAARAFDADPAGMTAYGTSVGYVPLRQWIADKHGVAPEQVIITNGSLAGSVRAHVAKMPRLLSLRNARSSARRV